MMIRKATKVSQPIDGKAVNSVHARPEGKRVSLDSVARSDIAA